MANENPGTRGAKKILFPNLNGVRFIAAFMVVICHLEERKDYFGLPTFYSSKTNLGGIGVTLFFVLSGFLITYLLLSEKHESGTVSLRDFYIRRILRIWPLYFIIILLGFFIIPNFIPFLHDEHNAQNLASNFNVKLILSLIFLPNVNLIVFPPILYVTQIWSVGVEEQFYLIWPVLVKRFKSHLPIICSIIGFFIVANFIVNQAFYRLSSDPTSSESIRSALFFTHRFLNFTRIDCMAVGGIGAWILFNNKHKILKVLYSLPVQVVSYAAPLFMIYSQVNFPYLDHLPYAVPFAIIILNLASNKSSIINLNYRPVNYLGKISYGIYMYHELAIVLGIKSFMVYVGPLGSRLYDSIMIYCLSISLTIILSAISYNLFEKYFLTKKITFSKIISGDNVTESRAGADLSPSER